MLSSKYLFAALLAVAAVGVNGSPVELEKRDPDRVIFCPDTWFDTLPETPQSCPVYASKPEECSYIDFADNDRMSTVKIGVGLRCTFYLWVKAPLLFFFVLLKLFFFSLFFPAALRSRRRNDGCTGGGFEVTKVEEYVDFPGGWNDAISSFMCHRV